MFKQFDIVKLKTTKGVKWLSGPAGSKTDPHGEWSVVAIVGDELVLCKDSTLIRASVEDVQKIANYNIEKLFKRKKDGQNKKETDSNQQSIDF